MRSVLLIALLCVAACGFEPVYKDGASTTAIHTPKTREGYVLKRELEGILYLDEGYDLTVLNINTGKKAATLEENRQRTRYDMTVSSRYVLSKDGVEVKRGKAKAVASYNVLDSDYNTYVGQEDAIQRALREVAEDIRGQILVVEKNNITL